VAAFVTGRRQATRCAQRDACGRGDGDGEKDMDIHVNIEGGEAGRWVGRLQFYVFAWLGLRLIISVFVLR
jgi:hypothetical protein